MASTLEKVTQERNDKNSSQRRSNKASYLKSDAELKKIFGITKDLRVYLTRIAQQLGSGEGFDSISPLVKSETYKEAEFIVKEEGRKQVIDFIYFPFFLLLFFTLQYCIGFAIHQHASATGGGSGWGTRVRVNTGNRF